jgi:hypothetical protein
MVTAFLHTVLSLVLNDVLESEVAHFTCLGIITGCTSHETFLTRERVCIIEKSLGEITPRLTRECLVNLN